MQGVKGSNYATTVLAGLAACGNMRMAGEAVGKGFPGRLGVTEEWAAHRPPLQGATGS